jgi:hypothetical protein
VAFSSRKSHIEDSSLGHVNSGSALVHRQAQARHYGKTSEGVPYSAFLKVAAPWGRGDLSAAGSVYSISCFAMSLPRHFAAYCELPKRPKVNLGPFDCE